MISGGQSPIRLRAGLALVLALVLFPSVQSIMGQVQVGSLNIAILAVQEIILGLLLGFTARLLFMAAEFGGTIIGYQMGFAAANIIDPQSQQQLQLLSQFQNVVAILVFLAVDGHHIFLRAMGASFDLLPPGGEPLVQEAIPALLSMTGEMFVLGLQLSAPIFVVLLLSDFILGIMSRIFPQLNAFMLKFPINIGVAFIFLGLSAEFVVAVLSDEFHDLAPRLLEFMNLVRQ